MASKPTHGHAESVASAFVPRRAGWRAITLSEAKHRLSCLVDDLARYVDYLNEEGVTEVACSPAIASESLAAPGTPQKSSPRPAMPLALPVSDADVNAKLKAIAQAVAACKKCGLHAKRRQAVPGQGHLQPDILFIGEGPGEDEDKQGLAFVGRAGQMLTRLIIRIGYTRDEVFIANIVKCRPPNNRKPLPAEMNMCRPYLEQQIAVLKPKVIVLLGASAFEGLIPPDLPGRTISKVRGKWLEYKGIPTMPTFHPSYLLRNQSAMWDVWNDMQLVLKHLGRAVPAKP
ncbi:MAG: uracil-DNA glycosylase [Kiritimatiellae bacterium]|nr:uracil-DNA glycosylase [Kiritimatiellia bacterium]